MNGRVFPKPVPARIMQSMPRIKASAQSNCHGYGLRPVRASQIAERACQVVLEQYLGVLVCRDERYAYDFS